MSHSTVAGSLHDSRISKIFVGPFALGTFTCQHVHDKDTYNTKSTTNTWLYNLKPGSLLSGRMFLLCSFA
jgi:hypothetical protein